jgi:hypothetical protein
MRDLIKEVNELVEDIEIGNETASGSLWIGFYDDGTIDTEFETHKLGNAVCPERLAYHSELVRQPWIEINQLVSDSFDHDEIVREVELREFEETDFYALANKI